MILSLIVVVILRYNGLKKQKFVFLLYAVCLELALFLTFEFGISIGEYISPEQFHFMQILVGIATIGQIIVLVYEFLKMKLPENWSEKLDSVKKAAIKVGVVFYIVFYCSFFSLKFPSSKS